MVHCKIRPPFFEIGPKSYLYGDQLLELALAADEASEKYEVDVIFTTPFVDIQRVAQRVKRLFVFAPHMDPIQPGRGVADILPEGLAAAGAVGVMLNHCERPLTLSALNQAIRRAEGVGLITIACSDTIEEARAIAQLAPDIIVAEPTALVGSGVTSGMDYVRESIDAVKSVNPGIMVLQGAGIKGGSDVYEVMRAGAEATGSSSGIAKAIDPAAMAREMIRAARAAYDELHA